jgi:uncharacterized protein YhdP
VDKADFKFSSLGADFSLSGSIQPTPDKKEGEPPVIGQFNVTASGAVNGKTIEAFWPVTLGKGARDFLKDKIEGAQLSELKGRFDLKRDSLADGQMRDEDLEVTFAVRDARVKFLSDMPAVEQASGRGRLTGNSFKVILDEGSFSGWRIDDGVVDVPAFYPKGQDFRVFARGQGEIRPIMEALNQSRFRVKFDPARLSGRGTGSFEYMQPALSAVPKEKIRFNGIGEMQDAGLKAAAFNLDLTEGKGKLTLSEKGITIAGFGSLGPSPVQFSWRDTFGDGNAPSNLSATSLVTPDTLNRLGFLGRTYMTGEAPVEVQAQLSADQLLASDISLDLTDARLDVSEIGWVKPKGTSAKATIRHSRAGDATQSKVLFSSDGARLDGDFTLGKDQKLLAATLRRAYLKNKADVNGEVRRTSTDQLNVALKGSYLDISGAFPGVGGVARPASEADQARKRSPMSMTAKVDTLTLRPGLDMRSADVSLYSGQRGVEKFSAKGKADDGSSLVASFDATGTAASKISVTGGNAGFLAKAFLDAKFLEGGKLTLDGTMPKNGGPSKFNVTITNARLRDAPFLTQVLSLASLRGLADTLGGEGVLFSRIDIPLTFAGGRYIVEGGKASGPALGLTANGYVESKSDRIEVDGVLVPSFGMNSALGGIPIIGDLVVGRDGEGVFSLTYGVNGTLKKANVSVNPLSALAPGVIRRIFENPSDTKIPEAKTRPKEQPIPSELAPIPTEEF